jgi:CRP-like cAMP-binding protein
MTNVVTAAVDVLAGCRRIALDPGVHYFTGDFPPDALLAVEDGFVVVRAIGRPDSRSVVTCEAGSGELVLPPARDEALAALSPASLRVVDVEARTRLFASPALAERVLEQLALALRHKQEATANLASTRHADRVRRRLLQLADRYGHVVRNGVRIDFPLSHALLAEMIGSSRETVTRAVDELQRSGFVVRDGSSYRLLQQPGENSHLV